MAFLHAQVPASGLSDLSFPGALGQGTPQPQSEALGQAQPREDTY